MDQGSKAGVEGATTGEVRKVHIVYFLSHDGGKVEQPHLLRVHHLHRNGVHIRDVKRWLSDVRGKDMPDSYAWSYKRRYKSGYVWQDLKDDELITPFSDNEYILKGSEISSKNNETSASGVEEEAILQVPTPKTPRRSLLRLEVCEVTSPKAPSPTEQESPGAVRPPPPSVSDASDESVERAADVRIDLWKRVQDRRHNKLRADETAAVSPVRHHVRSDSGGGGGGGSRWPGRKTSSLLRNLLTCGAVETSNSAVTVQRSRKDVPIESKSTCADSTNSRQCGKAFRPHPHTKPHNASEARGRKSIDKRKVVLEN